MKVSDFTYDLPEELIAQHPPKVRGSSRLLVLHKEAGNLEHRHYFDIINYLNAGDLLVLNNTKVIKARLITQNDKGQQRELLLLEDHHTIDPFSRKVLYRGKIHQGEVLVVEQTKITIDEVLDGGIAKISSQVPLLDLAEHVGAVPLPPYMHRDATSEDTERYQTVFAKELGSVAAPTASLNFTKELEQKLKDKGVHIAYLTLHVGLGTFMPIRSDDIEAHEMHSEYFEIPKETVEIIQQTKLNSGRIVSLGTTVARTLEYCAEQILSPEYSGLSGLDEVQGGNEKRTSRTNSTVSESRKQPTPQFAKRNSSVGSFAAQEAVSARKILSGEANIFIYPGYEFKVVDALLTNFHAPKTTVLMLAAAFAGWDSLEHVYNEAIKEKYALLSYGDSMLIL